MAKPFFDGYVKMPVTYQQMGRHIIHSKIEYCGDWHNQLRRIVGTAKKPKLRKFKIDIVLVSFDNQRDITCLDIKEPQSFFELDTLIYQYAKQVADDNPHTKIDLMNSWAEIRA